MELIITEFAKTDYSVEDIFNLFRASFKEHLAPGLNFTCSTMSLEDFIRRTKDAILLVATSKQDFGTQLVGAALFHIFIDRSDTKYGYLDYIAAHPQNKHNGICSSIFSAGTDILIAAGCKYVTSDTATKAVSSVNLHKKQGFSIVGLYSSIRPTTIHICSKNAFTPKKETDYLTRSHICVRTYS